MRFSSAVLFLGLMLGSTLGHGQEIFKQDRFTVRKVETVCRLEMAISLADQVGQKGNPPPETVAILGLYASNDYHGDLSTSIRRIGVVKDSVEIAFDAIKPRVIPFLAKSGGNDDNWRWQYLTDSNGLLEELKRRSAMVIAFAAGKESWRFKVPLKGSGNAVKALQQCK